MIQIDVDEGVAYDMFSILSIKSKFFSLDTMALANLYNLGERLDKCVGNSKHIEILYSIEYKALYQANLQIFERINALQERPEQLGDAKYIDSLNYQRFLAKKQIQEKFFNTALSEQKFGYKEEQKI